MQGISTNQILLGNVVITASGNTVYTNNSPVQAGNSALNTGIFNIPSGISTFSVTGLVLSSAPKGIISSVGRQSTGDLVMFNSPVWATATTSGFTNDLNGITDGSGYQLSYLLLF